MAVPGPLEIRLVLEFDRQEHLLLRGIDRHQGVVLDHVIPLPAQRLDITQRVQLPVQMRVVPFIHILSLREGFP